MSKEQNIPKATYTGILKIGDFEIRAYNLNTGERVLAREGFLRVMGRTGKPKYKEDLTDGGENQVFKLPLFLSANNLKPFINSELITSSQPIIFELPGGRMAYGYKAEILPSVCYVFIDAEKNAALNNSQIAIAKRCEILVRGFATIGIIALVDEATGYQFDREKDELQKILKAYISEELLAWGKRFPDEFYREIFRLNNWSFTPSQITSRPGIIGTWTKKYIYSVLPKGVLQALLDKTERNDKGKLKTHLHRHLTREQGIEHLNKQIISTVTLMNISDSWKQFEKVWNKKFGQQELFNEDLLDTPKKPVIKLEKAPFGKLLGAVAKAGKPEK